VQSALAHRLESPEERGKYPVLNQHREQQILDWIQQEAEKSTAVSKTEINDYCMRQFKASIIRGLVNSFILRHPGDIVQTKSVLQEQQRFQVPRVFLDRIVQNLNEHVQRRVAELLFNLDEVGISDWEDRKTRKVLVPARVTRQTMHDASWNISDHQAYFGDRLCLCCRIITHP
jgi:ribosomal protein L11 methylase PrmA